MRFTGCYLTLYKAFGPGCADLHSRYAASAPFVMMRLQCLVASLREPQEASHEASQELEAGRRDYLLYMIM